jgi:hypothetical protein
MRGRGRNGGNVAGQRVMSAACEFHALCEGLAALELRGVMTPGEKARIWHEALTALVTGYAIPAPQNRRTATATR